MTDSMEYLKLIGKLPEFYGTVDKNNANEWLTTIKMYKEFFPDDFNHKLFIAAVSSSLKEKASTWWYNHGKDITTWEKFEAEFIEKFIETNKDEAWNRLRTIKQEENGDMEKFVYEINKLFDSARITDDYTKISFFIPSVKTSVAVDLEKRKRQLKSYTDVTEEAIQLDAINTKYKVNERVQQINHFEKRVNFDLTGERQINTSNNSVNKGNSSIIDDKLSATSTLDSLAELVKGMQQLNINFVQQQQQIQRLEQKGSNYNYGNRQQSYNNRPPFGERRLVCWNCNKEGHPSRLCPEPPQQQGKDMGRQ